MIRVARTLARRLLVEDAGQDLIEYALLTMIVSIGSLLVFDVIRNKMGDAYEQWGTRFRTTGSRPTSVVI
jgi:Flp pilus assembly pilin Flp